MRGASSAADPFELGIAVGDAFTRVQGKTMSTPRIAAGESTGVIVVAGQSNAANVVAAFTSPTNASKIDNFNIHDGGTYTAVEPLLGASGNLGGNIFTRVADKLITAGVFARIILVPVAISGTTVAQWMSGGAYNARLTIACRRLAAVGLTPNAFIWMQGESDAGTSQANYTSRLASVIGTPRAIGFNAPWFIGKCTYIAGVVDANVQAAQVAAANGVDIFAGANTDSLTGTAVNRQGDNTHFTGAGAEAAADLWKTALDAVL